MCLRDTDIQYCVVWENLFGARWNQAAVAVTVNQVRRTACYLQLCIFVSTSMCISLRTVAVSITRLTAKTTRTLSSRF